MQKKILKAKLNKSGFTLVETLVAILIMAAVLTIVAYGIPMATKAYKDVVNSADAETVLSSTMNSLRNELANAATITILDDGNMIRYQRTSTGVKARISYNDNENDPIYSNGKGIYIQEWPFCSDEEEDEITPYDARLLITKYAATDELYAKCSFSFDVHTGIVTVNNLAIMKGDTTLTSVPRYCIQTGYKEP